MGITACLLWLEDASPELFDRVPDIRALAQGGGEVRLAPLPLVEASVCAYQTLTGMGPGKTGRFDRVRAAGYSVTEDTSTPDGVWQRLLPDLVRRAAHSVAYHEVDIAATPALLDGLDEECVIVRVRGAAHVGESEIAALIEQCERAVGAAGHLLLLSGVGGDTVTAHVNVNDYLADIGLLETTGDTRRDGAIAWSETLAYAFGTGQLRVNMRGREPAGAVQPGPEYDAVCEAVIAALQDQWRDPRTGERIVERVLNKSEAFPGEYLFSAPDMIVTFRPGYSASPRACLLQLDGQSVQPADALGQPQAPFARLIASGPGVQPASQQEGRLVDVVPTMLYLLGLPIPSHVDGQVLASIITPEHLQQAPIELTTDDVAYLNAEEELVITGRLEALGYLG